MKVNGELPVDHIKTQLSILSSLANEQIAFFDISSPSSLRRYTVMDFNNTKIKQLSMREFVAYELPLFKTPDDDRPITSYIVAVHRRLERQDRYLSPLTRHRMLFFGQPIIVGYNRNGEGKVTNKSIYENISKQLERLLRKNTEITSISNHALDCDDSLGQLYPFVLKHVTEDGRRCSLCPWNR